MKKAFDMVIIIGFLAVDFLLFHDLLKAGETYTFAQYLIGALSIITILRAAQSLAATTK